MTLKNEFAQKNTRSTQLESDLALFSDVIFESKETGTGNALYFKVRKVRDGWDAAFIEASPMDFRFIGISLDKNLNNIQSHDLAQQFQLLLKSNPNISLVGETTSEQQAVLQRLKDSFVDQRGALKEALKPAQNLSEDQKLLEPLCNKVFSRIDSSKGVEYFYFVPAENGKYMLYSLLKRKHSGMLNTQTISGHADKRKFILDASKVIDLVKTADAAFSGHLQVVSGGEGPKSVSQKDIKALQAFSSIRKSA